MYLKPHFDVRKIVAFDDASHTTNGSQGCFIIPVFYGEVKQGSALHLMTWGSQKSHRAVKWTQTSEILAASDVPDELIPLLEVLQTILKVKVVS